jgi:hypothetical protein
LGRTVVAVGRMAIRQAASILAGGFAASASGRAPRPGAQWRADRLLLSVDRKSVKFLAGNVLYEEDLDGFLKHEVPSGAPAGASQAGWLAGLSRFEMPFSMSLAATLALASDESVSGCFFLERFSCFYCNHRTHIELAARELRPVLERLFGLRQWPALFASCLDSMSELAHSSLPKGVTPPDVAAFLGRLLIGTGRDQITLADLPATVRELRQSPSEETLQFLRVPHLSRMLDTLEHFSGRAAPLLDRLRAAW